MANREALKQQSQSASQLAGTQQRAREGDPDALNAVAGTDFGEKLRAFKQSVSEAEYQDAIRENEVLTKTALNALSIDDPTQMRLYLERRSEQFKKDGKSTKNIDGALLLNDVDLMRRLKMQAEDGKKISDQFAEQNPSAETPTSLQKNLKAAGLVEGSEEFKAAVLDGTASPSTTVTVGDGEQAFSKEMAKGQAKGVMLVNEQADAAIDANQSLSVLENIDIETGALEPAKLALASFATAFGIDGSKIANVAGGEAFNAEAQRIVLSVKASQKGPQTDKDEITIRKTVAALGNSKQGNQFIIDSARALNNRRIGRKDFYDQFLQSTGGKFKNLDGVNADAAWSKFKRETPMISANQRTPEGLPVFFYKFDEAVRAANPDATRGQILEAWRAREKRAK
jgi:hypothetical protein